MNDRTKRMCTGLLVFALGALLMGGGANGTGSRALGTASGRAPSTSIPAEFRGTWTMYLETCVSGGETNISISAHEIALYENHGKIVSVRRISPAELAVRISMGGPRHPQPPTSAKLLLSEGGTKLALIEPGDLKVSWLQHCA